MPMLVLAVLVGFSRVRLGVHYPGDVIAGQTLAIAQFAGNEADRDLHRGGRPYEIVQRVPKERFDGSRGFRLLVSGRIANPGASAPMRPRLTSANGRPGSSARWARFTPRWRP